MPRRPFLLGLLAVLLLAAVTLGVFTPPELPRAVFVQPSPSPAAPVSFAPTVRTRTVTLRRGDTLLTALARLGFDRRASSEVAEALRSSGADLKKLRANDALEVTWTLEGEPVAVRWEQSPWLGFAAIATDAGWEVRRGDTRPDVRVEAVGGEVRRSLFESVEALGESPQLVMELVEIFSSDFDFTADTRAGDRFRLLVEKRYAGEQFVDYGQILVAQYLSDGRVLTGVSFEGAGGRVAYYDPDGRSLKKSFLKSPLEFTRITSGFTYARPHPILGGVRPHLAVDYGAPVGTPVRAVADGTVMVAGWNGGNGIQVHLRHHAGYETQYNHLSRLAPGVRAGTRVSQRQVIGYVGSTGLSTGPHLDYRVAKNGRFVNPLGEKFIPGQPLDGAEHRRFVKDARARPPARGRLALLARSHGARVRSGAGLASFVDPAHATSGHGHARQATQIAASSPDRLGVSVSHHGVARTGRPVWVRHGCPERSDERADGYSRHAGTEPPPRVVVRHRRDWVRVGVWVRRRLQQAADTRHRARVRGPRARARAAVPIARGCTPASLALRRRPVGRT